jgi:uncharacterized protein YodC (DUF2158 family)
VPKGEAAMQRKFQDGEEVVHKSARHHRMTVIVYTADGKVICRWKDKGGFQREEFLEAELEKWFPPDPETMGPFVIPPKPRSW